MHSVDWIIPHPHGIYIRPADMWVDVSTPQEHVLVTHGHADHARGGHGCTYATPATLDIMKLRYGVVDGVRLPYGACFTRHGVEISLHPAGHILGSAQILLKYGGERVVITGDYKRGKDPTCAPFELTPCDVLVTEATFALPVFEHPPIGVEINKLLRMNAENPDRTIIVGAYALGKAQRVIVSLRQAGYREPIYLHGAMEKMCALYEAHGIELGELRPATALASASLPGEIVICPPSALHDRWSRRFADPVLAMASGWMQVRQRARQKNIDLPLIISDHADWRELTGTISALRPSETWVTHGRAEALIRWCELNQLKARALHLIGREDEDEG